MIKISEKKNCCGCWACENICPKHAITMVEDHEGFKYPLVNTETCIDCHLCEKICPVINVSPEKEFPQHGYLLQIKDNAIRKESTSGGAFTAIASWIIKQDGVVFGAAFDYSDFTVRHYYVNSIQDLSKFRNSKYVQSDIGECYKQVKFFLNQGKWVAFSGTPCQIEGLWHYLHDKSYEKLILIDVVCYGIPSPGVFRDYIDYQQKRLGGEFTKVLFREKRLCYNYTSVSIFNKDKNKNYHCGVEKDKYMRSFFSNLNVRPSCYECKFKKRYRVSDFTIWDCYDVKKFSKDFDNNGTNRILVHTKKGLTLLKEIKGSILLEEYKDLDDFIKDEIAMVKSVPLSKKRTDFFHEYQTMKFENFINKWFPDTLLIQINSWLRQLCFKLGIYVATKRIVKRILRKK